MIVEMRLIPLILSCILVAATAAPNPGSYSSARHYQFQRSSSSYRNNELQHKNEEAGVYGRIEDPDKYDKPLEQSHYRQSSYNAPGTDTEDDTSPEDYQSQTVGIKGGRRHEYGHSGNYHRGYEHFGQGVIDSDYTSGDSFYQPGPGRPFTHTHGFHHPPGYNHHGHHEHRDFHHGQHGYHHQGQHGFRGEETSSQSSQTQTQTQTQTQNQNKDDQLISLDQTFDYSKFMNQGFGKEYLDNTEGQRVTSPRSIVSTTENIRPVFETTEAIPEQPEIFGQSGRDIQQQNQNRGQGQLFTTVLGQNSQQGQFTTVSGQNSQQGQLFTTVSGQNSQQGQVFTEDQSTTGLFGSDSQLENQDNQQQIDVGKIFQEEINSQQGQSAGGLNFQRGQTFQQGQTVSGQNSQQGQLFTTVSGQNSQQGQVFTEDQSTTGLFGSDSQMGNQDNQQQIDVGKLFQEEINSQQGQSAGGLNFQRGQTTGQSVSGQTFQRGQSTTGQTFQGQSTGQTIQGVSQTRDDYLKPIFEQIDQIAAMDSRDHTSFGSGTNQFNSGSSGIYPSFGHGTGRSYNYDQNRDIHHHTTGYIKPKYEPGVDEPDCNHHEKEEKKMEETTEEAPIEEMTTQQSFQETTIAASQQENNNMEMMNQERGEEMSGGNIEPMTTTVYYYHKAQEKDYDQEEDLTQQTQHFDQHFDDVQQHQDTFGKFDYDGQHPEDLTQQTQDSFGRIEFDGREDLTQQQQDGWKQLHVGNQEDLSQKPQGRDEEYGHLEFGGQQQEDLSQKAEDFHGTNYGNTGYGNNYGSNGYRNSYGYSTASSRSYSSSSSSRSSSSYGNSYNIQTADQTQDLTQNKEQFATEVQDVSQQVQKVEDLNLNLEEQKETPFEQEEIAVVAEEKPTEKPGFWKRLGGSITRTYETAKEKVKNNLG